MRPGGGKSKGSRFEREVCRSLSLWISNGSRDDVFWRSAMSGGRATIGLATDRVRGAQAGDISAIHSLGERLLNHVVVECKSYSDLQFFSGVLNDTGTLYRFWHDLLAHATKFGKHPMLIGRQNGLPTVCLLSPHATVNIFGMDEACLSAYVPRWGCYVILFDCFLREAQIPTTEPATPSRARVVL